MLVKIKWKLEFIQRVITAKKKEIDKLFKQYASETLLYSTFIYTSVLLALIHSIRYHWRTYTKNLKAKNQFES